MGFFVRSWSGAEVIITALFMLNVPPCLPLPEVVVVEGGGGGVSVRLE